VEVSPAKEPAPDLFTAPKDLWVEPDLPPRQTFSEPKTDDAAPRYVPLHDFEKKSVTPASPVSGADPYARFRTQRPSENGMAAFSGLWEDILGNLKALAETLVDPKQVALRRFVYWGLAVLAVFLLFWGVNNLNSQREEAMRARYKMPGKAAVVEAPAGVIPAPPVEREVTITPAPVKTKKVVAPDSTRLAGTPASGTYVVQVVTYPSRQDADQIVSALKREGLRAFVQENARPSGRVFYLVLIGGFSTASEAQAQLLKFRALEVARPFQDAFVRTNRS
jgi:cell division septation protein DedD